MGSTTDEHGYLKCQRELAESWRHIALRYEGFLKKNEICLVCGDRMSRTPVGPVCLLGHLPPTPDVKKLLVEWVKKVCSNE